jgi:hypothetical protein
MPRERARTCLTNRSWIVMDIDAGFYGLIGDSMP